MALFVLSLFAGCSKDDSNEPESETSPIIGWWGADFTDRLLNGKSIDFIKSSVVILYEIYEDGICCQELPRANWYSEGTYTFDEKSGRLVMDFGRS